MSTRPRQDEARPASPLDRSAVARTLRLAIWESGLSNINASLTAGAFQTGFALWLGANDLMMGVMGAVPTLAALAQLPASYLVERVRQRKPLTCWFGLIGRLLWLPILVLPFVVHRDVALAAFVALLIVSSIAVQASSPPYFSWMADVIPAAHLGRYFGRRNMIAGLSGMLVTLPMAWFVDLGAKQHRIPIGIAFAVPFAIAILCGIVGFFILMKPVEPAMSPDKHPMPASWREMLAFYRVPFTDRRFRPLLVFSGLFALAQFFAAPFYMVYALEVLKLNYVVLQILFSVSGLTNLLAMPLWGFLADRYGNRPVLAISVCNVAVLPAVWVFCRPEHMTLSLILIFTLNFIGGAGWAGVTLSQMNLMITASPAERKSVYVGAISAVTGLAGGIAPLLGAAVVTALRGRTFEVAGWPIDRYQALFGINSALRFIALLSLRGFVDATAARPRELLAHLGQLRVGSVVQMRRLQTRVREDTRRNAIRALRGPHGALAQSELTAALSDPSLHVRQDAALALAETRDPRAVEALTAALADPSSVIAPEAARALGLAGDRSAVPDLVCALEHRQREVRAHAAEALGRIGDPGSVPALLASARRSDDTALAHASVIALGAIGDARAAPGLGAMLGDAPPSLQGPLVDALARLGGPEAADALAAELRRVACTPEIVRVAVALAMAGERAHLPALLEAILRVEDTGARLVVVNAAGVLCGIEEVLYPALAADPAARVAAVERLCGELRHARASLAPAVDAALASFQAGEHAAAARHLSRAALHQSATDDADPRRAVLAWACAPPGHFGIEELLLTLAAAQSG